MSLGTHDILTVLIDFSSDFDKALPLLLRLLPKSNLDGDTGASASSSRKLDLGNVSHLSRERNAKMQLTPEIASIKEDFPLD